MSDLSKLRALCALSEVALNTRQAKLGALLQRREALEAQMAELSQAVQDRHDTAGQAQDDPALRAGADMLWLRWIEGRKIAINEARARLEVDIEAIRAEAARDFGRSQVAQRLRDQAVAARNKPVWGD